MYTLKNDKLVAKVAAKGAELVSVVKDEKPRLWDANPEFWGRTSPVLFPIVGAVAEGKYFVSGKEFQMGQHGLARDLEFEVVEQNEQKIWLSLVSTNETRKKYPFDFELLIGYELDRETVTVKWEVKNTGTAQMPFSIGAHPAFATEPSLADYVLQMGQKKGIESYAFNNDSGLVDLAIGKVQITEESSLLPLSKELFERYPTLILEGESEISLRSKVSEMEVRVNFEGFPYVGIWAPINGQNEVAPFVCIEPWYGMADTKLEPGELRDKKGIQLLDAGKTFATSYSMTFN